MALPSSSLLPYELSSAHYVTVFFCFVSLLLMLKLTRRNKSNLPPSPPKLPIIGNLHQLGTLPHRSFQALSRKRGFCTLRRRVETERKISVLELLSIKRVRSFQPIREEEVAELLDTLRESCASKVSCVNLSEMLIAASNNIVSRCVLGRKYDSPDGSSSFGELGRKMMKQLATLSVGDFFPSLGWVDFLTGQIAEFKATFLALDAFFDQLIAERKRIKRNGDRSHRNDFMEILLQIHEGGKHDFQLTHDNVKAILVDMFLGGSDTTSTLLEWTFAELMKNPSIMKKAQVEVRKVVGYKSKVDENDVSQMNYLKCVIKETLRLHPPAPLLIPRETLSDVKIKGFDIPSETRVFVNAWAIQRDPEFWNRPEEFVPERFEEEPEVDFKGQDLQYIPLGSGTRGCLGISFGLASTEYVLANLLYWFDWKLPNNGVPMQDIDMSEIHGLTVSEKVPLHLQTTLHSFVSKP
ncbi:steroid 17alpha-monooxygenase or 17alpha-hydroxyprogesterone aldolase [Spatholobus suberectus]|nr:steroid 17alpha-monooxygenase or 17alpha-hydroxyprogesterone aldolase [Spatholobus suberectus]